MDVDSNTSVTTGTNGLFDRVEFYANLLDSVRQAVIATDLEGTIIFWNDFAETLYGWSREEALGRPILDVTPSESARSMAGHIMHELAAGRSWSGEFVVRRRDGSTFTALVTDEPVFDEEGRLIAVVGLSIDVTQRREAELTLVERNRQLELLSETAGRLLLSENPAEFVEHVYRRLSEYLDLEIYFNYLIREDGGSLELFAYGGVPSEMAEAIAVLELGQAVCGTTALNRTEIVYNAVQSSDDPLTELIRSFGINAYACHPLIVDGRLFGTLSFGTRRRAHFRTDELALMRTVCDQVAMALQRAELLHREQRARAEAERSAERLARLQTITSAFAGAVTLEQVAVIAVEQGVGMMGARAGAMVLLLEDGRTLELARSTGYPEGFMDRWTRFSIDEDLPLCDAVRTGRAVFVEDIEDSKERYPGLYRSRQVGETNAVAAIPLTVGETVVGAFGLSFADARAFDGDDRAFMNALAQQCAHAIERARLYESERIARAAAESANLAKDHFLAVLSHELRTPLTPVLAITEMLDADESVPEDLRPAIAMIRRNVELEAQLINDLLDVTRITKDKLQLKLATVDLHQVLQEIRGFFREDLENKRLVLSLEPAARDHVITGDYMRLQQVFWNLVKNAIKFTPNEGVIVMRTSNPEPGRIAVEVIDTGIGIDPELLPFIFNAFEQGEKAITRSFGGLGLGLSITKALVELHAGSIRAHSDGRDRGAVFTVELALQEVKS